VKTISAEIDSILLDAFKENSNTRIVTFVSS
jgi:hypothetical protein